MRVENTVLYIVFMIKQSRPVHGRSTVARVVVVITVERLVISPAYTEAGVDPADRPAQPRHTDVEAGVLQLDISDLQAAVTVIISSTSWQRGALSHLTIMERCDSWGDNGILTRS